MIYNCKTCTYTHAYTHIDMHMYMHTYTYTSQEPSFNMDTTAPVDNYQLTFQTDGDSGAVTLNSTSTTLLLTDLKMGTVYTITVVATNTAGPGVPGQVVQATNIYRKLIGQDCT